MSRKNRIFVPSGIYHVFCRVTRGELVFGDEALAEHWVATVGEIAKLHQLTILAWCLLSNHYHLRKGARANNQTIIVATMLSTTSSLQDPPVAQVRGADL